MWKVLLHDWSGTTIGEFSDVKSLKLTNGLNKSDTLSFTTTLQSPMGKQLADRDYSIVTAWRYSPYTQSWVLKFSGVVYSQEENSADDLSTVGVSAISAWWQMSKRVANDANNNGRKQTGYSSPVKNYAYVADRIGNRIVVYDLDTGTHVFTFGSGGTGNGQFNGPRGVAIGENGSIYVADTGNHRIQKFDAAGNFLYKIGGTASGTGDYQFNQPYDIAVDASYNIYIVDKNNDRIMKYNQNGTFLKKRGAGFVETYAFDEMVGITYSQDGYLYIATNNAAPAYQFGYYKITTDLNVGGAVETLLGNFRKVDVGETIADRYIALGTGNVGKIAATSTSTTPKTFASSGLAQSIGVGLDKAVYVLESDASTISRIRKYDAAGNLSKTIGAYGSGTGQTRGATGFAVTKVGGKDAIQIAKDIIDYTNSSEDGSWIQVASDIGTSSSVFIAHNTWGGFKKISEAIDELSGAFEYTIRPKLTGVGAVNTLKLGEFYANSTIGDNKSNTIIFQYGTGKFNATSYSLKLSLEGLANKASYPAADAATYVITSQDTADIAEHGLFEEVITGSLIANDLRKTLTNLHLAFRKTPRMLVEFTVSRSDTTDTTHQVTPIPLIDYNPGDIVGVDIYENGSSRIPSAEARVYDIEIDIDDQGQETATVKTYIE